MKTKIVFEAPAADVFTADHTADKLLQTIPNVPINHYKGFLRPAENTEAVLKGDKCADEIKKNIIADFERSVEYCVRNNEQDPDLMVHVSTFTIIRGIIYMTYYANTDTEAESDSNQASRFAFCAANDPKDVTVIQLQKVGDILDGEVISKVYDTILMHKDDNEIYLMWTAATTQYYRFYCVYNIEKNTVGPIRVNRFKVGDITNDFSMSGIKNALNANGISHQQTFTDIGIMQKITSRLENGEIYYYTGAYSGFFNGIIKSRDFITWEYVASPDFPNNSKWENAVYVIGDKVYYFVRQQECEQGFLTCYDLIKKVWETPCLISDAQSRSDFIYYENNLYLIHAPKNREGFGIVRINTEDISDNSVVLVADMKESLFYPFIKIYDDKAYISYTVDRKHIRLSKFELKNYI